MISAKGKPGRPRNPNDAAGGKNQIPRSLGDVFRTIRGDRSQKAMLEAIEAVPSVYKLPVPKGKGRKRSTASISNWENATDNVPFAVQFRYARLVGTYSGVLHVISLFHANLRDAATGKASAEKLQHNRALAHGLIELANAALRKCSTEEVERLSTQLRELEDDAKTKLIGDLLSAYRRGAERPA